MRINFDHIAPYYDRLSKLVFGRSMFSAQTNFISHISPGAKVLVLGGGTGWLLSELISRNSTCKIWYVEASAEMLRLSAMKIGKSRQVTFIHGTQNSIPPEIKYDVVITHFFLDLFSSEELKHVVTKIGGALHDKAVWLVADFVDTTWWHSALLKLMYNFFYLTAGLSTKSLPCWITVMKEKGLVEIESRVFFNGFIRSGVWEKPPL